MFTRSNHIAQMNIAGALILLIILLPLTGFGQGYIGLSKKQVRRALEKQAAANDTIHIVLAETDSSIHYSFRDLHFLPADFIYNFDKNGKCNEEIVIANCDSCFYKYLQKAVDRKKIGWKKLKENLYISSYVKKMMLEIRVDIPHSFVIRRMKWNRQVYNTLLTSK